ncbi:MAG TPA: diaminopimelate decarboxylase [Candidatus Polarisedimenticolia bacterium]|nr:diaminopimelate decarboxylase [Candidatus Polarisedimenticolia bacterium]
MIPPSEAPKILRPPGFVLHESRKGLFRRSGTLALHCDHVPLTILAKRYGTPLYVYSATSLLARLADFNKAFHHVPHTICYSVKANSNISILRLLAREGCGFDVVSGGELERVLVANQRAAKKIVFSGVGKSREEMTAALKAGILLFNVESESELWALAECAIRSRTMARIALRVNPDVAAETHPYISTGLRKHKFGVPIGSARELYAKASAARYLKVAGVSVHIGSQITDVRPFADAVDRVAALVRELRADGHRMDYIDTGGGLGIDYQEPLSAFSDCLARYARAITNPLRGLKVHLLLEPGRSIVGPGGALVTSVIYRKENGGKHFLVVDAAMNDLIRPALYGAYHEIAPVIQSRAPTTAKPETVDVVGPVCESGDFFARDREMPRVEERDLLAILDAGAYGMALASNYNTRPRPPEVLVHGKSVKLIRRRERVTELYAAEL